MSSREVPGAGQLANLARIARIATEDLELRPMLQRIGDSLAEMFRWEFVALMRADRESRRFVCEAVSSRVETEVTVGFTRGFDSGVVGYVAATGEPLRIDDTATFAGFEDTLHGARSELCVPIRHRGETVAVLDLQSRRLAAFRDQLPLVEAVAGQIAGAIASARHFEETRRRAVSFAILSEVTKAALEEEELDSVLSRVATYLRDRFDFHLVAIVVADEGGNEWVHRAFATSGSIEMKPREHWPVEAGVVGRTIRTGRPQLVLDVARDPDYFAIDDRVRSEFVVPLKWGGGTLGALNVESDRVDAFPPATRELIELVADQVSGAIRLALLNRNLSETKQELERANARLEVLSLLDPLTGVANRRRFDSALELEWRRQARAEKPLSLLLLDVDCFKAFNDSRGHLEGDRCLQRVGELLREAALRAGDLAARYGGEEFAVLLTSAGADAAQAVAERLRAGIEALAIPHPASTVAPVVTASVGVATRLPSGSGSPLDLIAAADEALYRAKRGGRNRVLTAAEPG
jgi:diguanylate cyclase (GGDEF)-like protein